MHNLEYRHPRTRARFDISFVHDGQTLHGQCFDVSEAGIRARFHAATPIGATGLLTLQSHNGTHTLKARITYIHGADAGLAFVRDTAQDRGAARQFSAFLASCATPNNLLTFR